MTKPAFQPTNSSLVWAGSEVQLDEWITPETVDASGDLSAGQVLEWLDVVGGLAATRHCGQPVVTASVDGLTFRDNLPLGSQASLMASVAHTSERSMGVSVELRGPVGLVLEAFMTFVAVDSAGQVLKVAQLVPETQSQVERFREGRLRREFRKRLQAGQLAPPPTQPARSQRLYILEFLKQIPQRWVQRERSREKSSLHKVQGTLHGGTLMRWLETTAAQSAAAFLSRPVRLVGLHGLNFLKSVAPDRLVHIRALVVHGDERTLTTLVNVESEDPGGTRVEVLRAFLTFAAADGRTVPPVSRAGEEENALFAEVEYRLSLHRKLAPLG